MTSISAFEAKTRFGELLERVMAGEEIVITRREKPVARIIPEKASRLDDVQRAAEGLEALQKEIAGTAAGKKKYAWKEFKKSFVEEGRR